MNHILVVDDDPSIRQVVTLALESRDYSVTTASDGAEAIEQIVQDPPSAMLLDLQMPRLDGWGVARRMRELGQWIPTVVMTAAVDAPRWCAEIGADACLSKPFGIAELFLAIERVRTPALTDSHPR